MGQWLWLWGVCCAWVGVAPRAVAAAPPNVVVCIADDVSYGDFGCNGNPDVRTPRIDRLAADGIRFTTAYLTASSCSPSRLSILTGRYPHNNGAACELHRPLPAHIPTLPDLLQQAGFFTALAGKHHLPRAGLPDTAGWNVVRSAPLPGASGGEEEWLVTLRERPAGVPFFLWLASIDAHRGWLAAAEWHESRYGPRHDPRGLAVPPWMPDTPAARADLACYYDEITRFDWHVGQVVDELERQGVLDETLIVVTSDNGRPFPRGKTRLHDEGMQMPLVIRGPGAAGGRGIVCGALVSAIDLCPTILDLAGVALPPSVQGVSLVPLLANPALRPRQYAFSEHNWHDYEAHGRAVRDAAGRLYIRNARPERAWIGSADSVASPTHRDLRSVPATGPRAALRADVFLEPRPAEELYDTPRDPWQIDSLVGRPEAVAWLAELRDVLDRWQEETGDGLAAEFSRDRFDRTTGGPLADAPPPGMPPGAARRAEWIDAPGPRERQGGVP